MATCWGLWFVERRGIRLALAPLPTTKLRPDYPNRHARPVKGVGSPATNGGAFGRKSGRKRRSQKAKSDKQAGPILWFLDKVCQVCRLFVSRCVFHFASTASCPLCPQSDKVSQPTPAKTDAADQVTATKDKVNRASSKKPSRARHGPSARWQSGLVPPPKESRSN